MQYVSNRASSNDKTDINDVHAIGKNPLKKLVEKQLKTNFLDEGELDMDELQIKFWCSVNRNSCEDLLKCIGKAEEILMKMHYKYKMPIEHLPYIELYINSNGGDLMAAFAVINHIQNSQFKFRSIIEGQAASAGSMIAVVCDDRQVRENSTILVHQLSTSLFYTKYEDLKQEVIFCEKLMNSIMKIYMENTKMTAQTVKSLLKRDISWSSDECLDLGLVDSVIKPTKPPRRQLRTKQYKISRKELEFGATKARQQRERDNNTNPYSDMLNAIMGKNDDDGDDDGNDGYSEDETNNPPAKKRKIEKKSNKNKNK